MLYLATGVDAAILERMANNQLGLLLTPNYKRRPGHKPTFIWAADNGCFNPINWSTERWWKWLLSERSNKHTCLFATAPDVVGNADETLGQSFAWLPRIRELGYPAAFVAQDGMQNLKMPWNLFDVLFLGGSTEWKLGPHAFALAHQATALGKPVHMGRVNSGKRWQTASAFGCSSVDGTFLTYAPKHNLQRLLKWTQQQPTLFEQSPKLMTERAHQEH